MALSEIDRNLLQRCLDRKPRAWEDFVDRFLGLVVHVVNHTSQVRGIELTKEDRDDLCAEVFLGICLLYTSPSPRDRQKSRMPSSA